jgi:S-adenosylhomocysteine hydrolase
MSNNELSREESKHPIVTVVDEFQIALTGKTHKLNYNFDSVFGPDSTQDQVFEETRRLVQSAIDGFNVCIFAYGQTGSGKTHTIQGNASNPGITPRSIEELFNTVHSMNNFDVKLICYMVELYKEDLRDLLLPKG